MAKTLQEQLMGAGLVDQKKAKSLQKEVRTQRKQMGKGQAQQEQLEQLQRVEEQKQAKLDKDRELNRLKKLELDKKAIQAQIKQLIESNTIKRQQGEVGFQFVHDKKIKRIFISEEQQRHLARGVLAVVVLAGEYLFIPRTIAEKVSQRDPSAVLFLQQEQERKNEDQDDPYKDYQIPDDLMW